LHAIRVLLLDEGRPGRSPGGRAETRGVLAPARASGSFRRPSQRPFPEVWLASRRRRGSGPHSWSQVIPSTPTGSTTRGSRSGSQDAGLVVPQPAQLVAPKSKGRRRWGVPRLRLRGRLRHPGGSSDEPRGSHDGSQVAYDGWIVDVATGEPVTPVPGWAWVINAWTQQSLECAARRTAAAPVTSGSQAQNDRSCLASTVLRRRTSRWSGCRFPDRERQNLVIAVNSREAGALDGYLGKLFVRCRLDARAPVGLSCERALDGVEDITWASSRCQKPDSGR